jgi:hypothetical protein
MTSSIIKPHTAAVLVTVNGVAKIILGIFQTDGVVVPPGSTVISSSNISVTTPKT